METTGHEDEQGMPGKRPMVFLALLALAVRLLYFAEHSASPFFAIPLLDQKYYDLFAQAIASGGDLLQFGGFRPMLYPLFLAPSYWLGGPQLGVVLAILLQHIFGIIITLLVARLAGKLFRDWRTGVAAGVLYALASPPLYFEGELLIEPFLAFMVVILFVILLKACEEESAGWWIAVGAWTGLCAQARPNVLLFFGAFAAALIWWLWRKDFPRAKHTGFAIGAGLVVLAVFGFVNKAQSGHWQPLTSAGGINFYAGNNREADGMIPRQARSVSYLGEYRDSLQVFATQEYERAMREAGEVPSQRGRDVSSYWMAQTRGEIAAAPGRWLTLMMKKTWLLFWSHEVANNKSFAFVLQEESMLLRLLPVRWWLLIGLFPVGVVTAWKRGRLDLLYWLLAFFALYGLSIVLFFVNSRFRIPLWPIAAILGGGALLTFYEFVKEQNGRRLGQMFALFVGGAVISLTNLWGVTPPDFSRDYFFRSIANSELGRLNAALSDAQKSIELDPTSPDTGLQLGNVAYRMGDLQTAEIAYRQVTELVPSEPRGWNNLGAVYEGMSRYAEAIQCYDRANIEAGGHPSSLINAAMLEMRAGMRDSAARRLVEAERLLEGSPPRADLLGAFAFFEELRGNSAGRADFLQQALQVDQSMIERMSAEFQIKIPRRQLYPE